MNRSSSSIASAGVSRQEISSSDSMGQSEKSVKGNASDNEHRDDADGYGNVDGIVGERFDSCHGRIERDGERAGGDAATKFGDKSRHEADGGTIGDSPDQTTDDSAKEEVAGIMDPEISPGIGVEESPDEDKDGHAPLAEDEGEDGGEGERIGSVA